MKMVRFVALLLVVIGALNWGLVGKVVVRMGERSTVPDDSLF